MATLCPACGYLHPQPGMDTCRFKTAALERYNRLGSQERYNRLSGQERYNRLGGQERYNILGGQDTKWKLFMDQSVLKEWNPNISPHGDALITPVNQVCELLFVIGDKTTLPGPVEHGSSRDVPIPRAIHVVHTNPQPVDMETLQQELQGIIGVAPVVQVGEFRNWASTQVKQQVLTVWPRTVQEVQQVVLGARALGLRVRAAGGGHSWSPLFADEGNVVLYTKHLERPDGRPRMELLQDPADGSMYVTMASSVTVEEFKKFQLNHGVCLPANVIFDAPQMGGVVVPGCHGGGWNTHPVSDYVHTMHIVNSNGELCEYSKAQDEHMMRAVQCNLGLWGIIIDMTIKVDKMVIVESENQFMTMRDLFYTPGVLCNLLHTNMSVEIFWFPYNGIPTSEAVEAFLEKRVDCADWDPMEDEVWVRLVNKTEREDVEPEFTYKVMHLLQWLRMKSLDMFDGFIARFPQATPAFLKAQVSFMKSQFAGKRVQELPHAVHFLKHVQDVPINEMEWAFSVDEDCSNLMHAIQELVALVHREALQGRFPMNLPLEMRFIGDSQAYMAPAVCANHNYGGSGHTCYMEVLTAIGTPGWQDYTEKVSHILSKLSGARPHWAKEWGELPGIDNFIRQAYAQQIPKFLSALASSGADPEGVFLNQRLENIFFPQGHPGKRSRVSYARSRSTHSRQKVKRANYWCQIL